MENLPWEEKYRPSNLNDLIVDDPTRQLLQQYVDDKNIGHHMLFVGSAGLGKTTTAKILAEAMSGDYLYICASGKGIDEIRNKVTDFCVTAGWGGLKTVVLDEFDGISQGAQMMLRNVLEEFVENARFILTCNYANKVLEPIRSRCLVLEYKGWDEKLIGKRCFDILEAEGVKVKSKKDVVRLVRKFYPDVRSVVKNLDRFTVRGVFSYSGINDTSNLEKEFIELIKNKNFDKIRSEIIGQADFVELFRLLFDNATIIGGDNAPIVRMHVLEGIRHHTQVVDQEINFMGTVDGIIQEI